MTDYHPVTAFFRDLQINVLPDDMTSNIASSWIQVISDTTKHEGDGVDDWLIREVASRLAALAMPVFVALATIQLTGVLVCQVALMALGQEHDDIYKSATDLLRMIGALVTSVLAYPFSVIDPTVYQRTPEQVIPKKDPKPELDEDTKKDTLPATASSEQSKVSIYKSLKTRLIGIEHIKHHLHDTFTSIPTCGAIDGKQDKTQWKSTTKLDTSDQLTAFLLPKGTIEVQLDYSEEGNLQTDVSRLRGVDRLVLKNAKTQDIISLDNPSPLSQIHTLVLEEVDFTEADLIKIAEKFPNIACFDLSHCVFEGKLDKLAQSHIVCFPHTSDPKTGKSSRTVKFHFSNAGDQYEDLNKILWLRVLWFCRDNNG